MIAVDRLLSVFDPVALSTVNGTGSLLGGSVSCAVRVTVPVVVLAGLLAGPVSRVSVDMVMDLKGGANAKFPFYMVYVRISQTLLLKG